MSKAFLLFAKLLTVLMIVILLACAAKQEESAYYIPGGQIAPTNLIVEPSNQTLKLNWTTNRTTDMVISGYNIYITEIPLAEDMPISVNGDITPYNLTVYPGDDDPEISFETVTATELENGVKYYVAITTVYPDRTESLPSNIIEVVCYPQGTVLLKDRAMGGQHGFSFSLESHVDYNDLANDLYFIARNAGNIIGSPDRNEGVLNHTEFAEIPTARTLDFRVNYQNLAFKDKTFVAEGKVYLLKLSDGSFAKIKVKQVDGSAYKKQILFDYIYLVP